MAKKKIENGGRNAVIYARYSSHNQREVSIEQQVQKCTEFAEREGLTVINIYSDAAISGRTDNRPAFQRMMKDCRKHEFQYVVAWKSNRIGRDMLEAMINNATLMREGVRCLYVEEDFDDTASGRFALRTMMNVNQFYSENMAEDIRRGLMDNASKAMANTRAPFGYAIGEDRKYVIREDQAEIVRQIFHRVLEGWSYAELMEDLNRRGIKTALGHKWNKNSFHAMLHNEMYIGVYKYSTIRIEGGVPALIEKSLFEEVQHRLRTKKNPIGRSRNCAEYLLTGKLFCGHCKEPMVGISGTGKHGELHYYYTCQGKRKKINNCTKKNVIRDRIEQQVIQAVRDYVLQDEVINTLVESFTRFYEAAKTDSEFVARKKELEQTKKAISNLLKAMEMGIITESTKARLMELEDSRKDLEESLLKEEEVLERITPDQVRFFLESFKSMDADDRDVQRQFITTFIDKIYLYDDHMKILFSFDPAKERKVELEDAETEDSGLSSGSYTDSLAPLTNLYTNPATIIVCAHGFILKVPV